MLRSAHTPAEQLDHAEAVMEQNAKLRAQIKNLETLVMGVADTTEGVLLRNIGDCSWLQARSAVMKLASPLRTEPASEPTGSFSCSVCGSPEPHHHPAEFVNEWREEYPDPNLRLPFEDWLSRKFKPSAPGHLGDYMDQIRRQNQDLAMLVRSLIWTLNKYSPGHSMTWKAKDYLKRHGLEGSPLRSESETD